MADNIKIVGNTVGVPNPRSDWSQTDPTKADYIKNKPDIESMADKTYVDDKVANLKEQITDKSSVDYVDQSVAGAYLDLQNMISEKVDKDEYDVKISSYDEYVNDLYYITSNQVDKVSGMGLSSNDFTDALKTRLEHINIITDSENLSHYQDSERILGFLKAGNYSNGLNIICTGDYSYEYGLLIVSPSDYKEAVYIDPFGYILRFECETFYDEDWVLIGSAYATKTYIDNAIGDVETSLDNIIKKYGLGGDGV